MNYFELHIGDYAEATQHLTILEDGVYSRLLRKYYASEKPLPVDVAMVQRLIVARSKDEKAAVEVVLQEFFVLEKDGWHQPRCDDEIERYTSGEPERKAKKANEDERQRRHREERAELFTKLTAAGEHAPWNLPIKDLRERVAGLPIAVLGGQPVTPATAPETLQADKPATAPATPATATQTPFPNTHYPDTTTQTPTNIDINTPQPPKGGRKRPRQPVEELPGFVRFWGAWPSSKRKESRGKCAEAWVREDLEALTDVIVSHVEAKRDQTDWAHDGGQFVEAPMVYLNNRKWEGAEIGKGGSVGAGQGAEGLPDWCVQAGFEHIAQAQNARCHLGNFREFRDGKRITDEVPA